MYISTTDDEVSDVVARFGGTWKKYAEGRTLVGVGTNTDSNGNVTTYTADLTGGNSDIANININHTHSYAHTHTVPGHYHTLSNNGFAKIAYGIADKMILMERINTADWVVHHKFVVSSISQADGSTVPYGTGLGGKTDSSAALTTNSQSTSTTGTMSANSTINAQDPYIAVYMYKRTE